MYRTKLYRARQGTLFLLHTVNHLTVFKNVQQDATYSVYYTSVSSSTCFGC